MINDLRTIYKLRHCHPLYSQPRLRTKFGERAFSHAGPATWNALPDHIRTVADPLKCWKLLKSRFFNQPFNICWLFACFLCFSIWLTSIIHLGPLSNGRTINY